MLNYVRRHFRNPFADDLGPTGWFKTTFPTHVSVPARVGPEPAGPGGSTAVAAALSDKGEAAAEPQRLVTIAEALADRGVAAAEAPRCGTAAEAFADRKDWWCNPGADWGFTHTLAALRPSRSSDSLVQVHPLEQQPRDEEIAEKRALWLWNPVAEWSMPQTPAALNCSSSSSGHLLLLPLGWKLCNKKATAPAENQRMEGEVLSSLTLSAPMPAA